ncbi:phosphohistidine phosphatase SixA [Agaribacterium sp. ZY112]|uniref:phosphohistidine phosphatase SixA n=1 Tax=Agaribacterium sp. ZY112 TaxID=3233574 RepID=UPI0035249001
MRLLILRHGHAEAEASADNLRALSAEGELEVHSVCQKRCDELAELELVLHSPYLRTCQTADILTQYTPAPKQELDLLVPNANPKVLIDQLYSLSQKHSCIALVSHQPLVGTLVDHLCAFEYGRYRMGTASLACLKGDPVVSGVCELEWLDRP